MLPLKQSVADWITARIEGADGVGVTGLVYNSAGLSLRLAKAGAAAATKTLGATDWVEQSNGYYWTKMSASDLDTVGPGTLIVIYAGSEVAVPFRVSANLVDDVATTATGVKVKTDNLPANPASQTNLDVAVSTRLAAASYTAPDNASIATILANTVRLLGLTHDNVYIDQHAFDGDGNLTGARLRCYDSKTNADTHDVTGLQGTYLVTATYVNKLQTSFKMTRDA